MAVTFPYVRAAVWADGSTTDTAAKRNTIEDGIFNAHQQPAVRVFHNTTQSIPATTFTKLAFNSERFDTAGGAATTHHDTVTNNSRLTCRYAGKYQITANAELAASAAAAAIEIYLNNTTVIGRSYINATQYITLNATTLYDLAVNDFVEVRIYQGGAGAINIVSTGNYSPEFMMVRVA